MARRIRGVIFDVPLAAVYANTAYSANANSSNIVAGNFPKRFSFQVQQPGATNKFTTSTSLFASWTAYTSGTLTGATVQFRPASNQAATTSVPTRATSIQIYQTFVSNATTGLITTINIPASPSAVTTYPAANTWAYNFSGGDLFSINFIAGDSLTSKTPGQGLLITFNYFTAG